MKKQSISRRAFLSASASALAATALAACQPTPSIVKETVVVAGTPQIVKETVVVPGTPKVVKETVVVQPTRAPAEITLTWGWWGTVANLEAATPKTRPFREAFPHVVVQPIYMPGSEYNTKILTMFAGGTAPDAIMVQAEYAPDWFSKGLAADLGPLLDKDPKADKKDWVESLLVYMTVGGKLYGLPYDAGPMTWQYNTKIVAESGKPTPLDLYKQGHWNYDTHIEWCLANTNAQKKVYSWTDSYSWSFWMPLAWSYGGEFFDAEESKCLVDSEPWVRAIQYVLDMKDKHKVLPPPGASDELGLNFRSGNVAMMGAWPQQPWFRSQSLGGTQMVQPCYLPAGPKGHKCLTKANCHCVCAKSKYIDLSYELVKVLCGPQGEWLNQESMKYIFPGTKKNFDNPAFWALAAWDQSIQRISNEEHGHKIPITHRIPWTQMQATWEQYTDQVWMNKITPAQCCASIAKDINALLKKSSS